MYLRSIAVVNDVIKIFSSRDWVLAKYFSGFSSAERAFNKSLDEKLWD